VFDVAGRHVVTLEEGIRPAGRHRAAWDARDARGRRVGAGVYFWRLEADAGTISRRLIVVR
ncbi:MAG: FlgD immunoglobulin-like domain containing protein, partial [bacterium]